MNLKEYALAYAKQGFSVFPLLPMDKRPITKNGCKDATRDLKQIERWWDTNPNYNIGIACGTYSSLLVIDLDIDEEKGINGYESLKDWERVNGKLPETWQTITGKGGCHLFYRTNKTYNNNVSLYSGIDIRTTGGYIVAPPSVHPNGRRYEWEIGMGDGVEMAAVNETVEKFLTKPKKENGKTEPFVMPDIIAENRNKTLYSMACSMRARGNVESAIKAALQATNRDCCKPPLDDKELEQIFKNAMKQESGTAPYKTVCDNGSTRPLKSELKNFNLSKVIDVEIKEPEWLIPGYIPKYGITTIAGEGGVGKTSIWCSIVSSISTGKPSILFGDDTPFHGKPGIVVVFSAEDSWNYVLKQKLINNGADMNNILYMSPEDERFVDLNFNGDLLKGIIETNKPDLVVFDPVQAFVPENLRMGDRNAMRKCFSPLMGFGATYGTTSIIIAHANKQSGVWGRKRIADSSDIWDASRSVLMTGIVPNSDGVRYISHEKSNWGLTQDSILLRLNNGVPMFKS